MRLARIVLSTPEETASMLDTLQRAGIAVRQSSPVELEIESTEAAEQIALHPEIAQEASLGAAIAAFEAADAYGAPAEMASGEAMPEPAAEQPVTVDANAAVVDAQREYAYPEDYVPEREFVLAPAWRAMKAKLSGMAPDLAPVALYAKGLKKIVRDANESLAAELAKAGEKAREAAKKLHEAEERILKEEPERFVELIKKDLPRPMKMDPLFARMKKPTGLRVSLSKLSAAQAAACGAAAMAALMLIGFAVTQRPNLPSERGGVTLTSAPVAAQQGVPAAPAAQAKLVASKPAASKPVVVAKAKPSPASPVRHAAKRRARSNDDQEVVTHYYKPSRPQLQRASYGGVRQYSDIE